MIRRVVSYFAPPGRKTGPGFLNLHYWSIYFIKTKLYMHTKIWWSYVHIRYLVHVQKWTYLALGWPYGWALNFKCLLAGQIIVLPADDHIARSSMVWPNDTPILWVPLAKNMQDNDCIRFWRNVANTNQRKTPLSNMVNGCNGPSDIAMMWKTHFAQLVRCGDQHSESRKCCR